MGGDELFEELSEHLGIGNDETTEDGAITLERIECNAACDYAPVMMVNWEFFDNQSPASAAQVVDDLRLGKDVAPTRGASSVCSFKAMSRVLAGFSDGRADEGTGAGTPTTEGTRLARTNGWEAPETAPAPADDPAPASKDAPAEPAAAPATGGEQSSAERTAQGPADTSSHTQTSTSSTPPPADSDTDTDTKPEGGK